MASDLSRKLRHIEWHLDVRPEVDPDLSRDPYPHIERDSTAMAEFKPAERWLRYADGSSDIDLCPSFSQARATDSFPESDR